MGVKLSAAIVKSNPFTIYKKFYIKYIGKNIYHISEDAEFTSIAEVKTFPGVLNHLSVTNNHSVIKPKL